jgi:hypothetical protein
MEAFIGHGRDQTAAAVALVACDERSLQVDAGLAYERLGRTMLSVVITGSADVQDAAALLDRNGLLLQIFHLLRCPSKLDHSTRQKKEALPPMERVKGIEPSS